MRLDAGQGRGKGVFATRGFKEGDVLWQETPLVACHHVHNRDVSSVCAHCPGTRRLGAEPPGLGWFSIRECIHSRQRRACGL